MSTRIFGAALAALLLGGAAAPALAQDQSYPLPTGRMVYMGGKDNTTLFFSLDGATRSGNMIEFTTLAVQDPPGDPAHKGPTPMLVLRYKEDCSTRMDQAIWFGGFDENGQLLFGQALGDPPRENGENTPMSRAAAALCDGAPTPDAFAGGWQATLDRGRQMIRSGATK